MGVLGLVFLGVRFSVFGFRSVGSGFRIEDLGLERVWIGRFRARREPLERFKEVSPERQGQHLALTVLSVPITSSSSLLLSSLELSDTKVYEP